MASSSKVFILLGLMLAIVLLISSEVTAAKDLAAAQTKTKEETAETNGIEESKSGGRYLGYGGGGREGCRYEGCHGGCCTYAGEAKDAQISTEPQN